jgi:hypothetical protein
LRPGGSVLEVFRVALRLGLTSFGGPVAHLGYFRREYVERRRWLDENAFADLVALCQSFSSPASSQLGIAIGARRAGIRGGIVAWLGFTLPSAIVLGFVAGLAGASDLAGAGARPTGSSSPSSPSSRRRSGQWPVRWRPTGRAALSRSWRLQSPSSGRSRSHTSRSSLAERSSAGSYS